MADDNARDATQPVDVTLTALVGGVRIGSLTQQKTNPPYSVVRWVTAPQRGNASFSARFDVPAAWLALAVLSGKQLDFEGTVSLPVGGPSPIVQCPLVVQTDPARGCGANDTYRVDDVPVYDDIAELTVKSLALVRRFEQRPGEADALASPDQVLAKVVDLFPGGERLDILPYSETIDIRRAVAYNALDTACGHGLVTVEDTVRRNDRVRDCRIKHVVIEIADWLRGNAKNREGYNVLMGVHDYLFRDPPDPGIEPGWKNSSTPAIGKPGDRPIITVNDGSVARPLTAATHELMHALGVLDHADRDRAARPGPTTARRSRGGSSDTWPPDNTGRLRAGLRRHDQQLGATPGHGRGRALRPHVVLRRTSMRTRGSPRATGTGHAACCATSTASPARVGAPRRSRAGRPGRAMRSAPSPRPARASIASSCRRRQPRARGRCVLATGLRTLDARREAARRDGAEINGLADDPPGSATFAARVPPGAASVELVSRGTVVDRRDAGRARRSSACSPRARDARLPLVDRPLVGGDPDREPLRASSTSRERRLGLAHGLPGPSAGRATIPASLPGGASGRPRPRHDHRRLQRGQRASGRFSAPGRPPIVRIFGPAAGSGFRPGGWCSPARLSTTCTAPDARREADVFYAGSRRLGTGERLRTPLPGGPGDAAPRRADGTRRPRRRARVHVAPVPLRLTRLGFPSRLARGAPAPCRSASPRRPPRRCAGGRTFAIGARAPDRRGAGSLPARAC